MKSYFKPSEHTCKCGCGLETMDKTHMYMLNQARDLAGIPFVVNSGRRCEQHNKAEGGRATSSHLLGFASDLLAKSSRARFLIVRALIVVGFCRIQINFKKGYVHVDNDPAKIKQLLW